MPRRIHRLIPVAIALTLVLGCSSNPSKSSSGPLPAADAKIKVAFIPKNTGNPYFNQVAKGFEQASGIEFTLQAPATADATSQISIIKEQVQRGVTAIAISANSPDALNESLDQAREKGVMVLTVDSDLTGNESHRDFGVLPTDFKKIGPSQIELLGSQMGYEGEFAILSATTDAPNQNAWIETMKAQLKNSKYAKMKLVEIVYGDDEPQKSSTEAEALLTKHPNLRGIISPTSVGLAAAAQVLENSGLYPGGPKAAGSGVVLTGLSTPNQLKKFVKKGVVASFQLWDPADMAIIATHIAANKLKLKTGDTFEVPDKGKFTVESNNVIYAGPLLTFNKDNIDQYDF
jgi:rhamnose transport system substrate-binding protein